MILIYSCLLLLLLLCALLYVDLSVVIVTVVEPFNFCPAFLSGFVNSQGVIKKKTVDVRV